MVSEGKRNVLWLRNKAYYNAFFDWGCLWIITEYFFSIHGVSSLRVSLKIILVLYGLLAKSECARKPLVPFSFLDSLNVKSADWKETFVYVFGRQESLINDFEWISLKRFYKIYNWTNWGTLEISRYLGNIPFKFK